MSETIEVGHIQMSDNTSALFAALAIAQSKFTSVSKERTVDVRSDKANYSYRYATLDAVWDEVRPHLTENEICTIQSPHTDGNDVSVTTMLGHSSGQWIAGTVTLKATKPDAQGAGSAITYARRYSLQGIVGVTPEEDDDARGAAGLGASASTGTSKSPGSGLSQITCPKCGKVGSIIKGKEEYGGGWLCFQKKEGCGAKFTENPADAKPPKPPETADLAKQLTHLLQNEIGCNNAEEASEVLTWLSGGEYSSATQYRASPSDAKAVNDMIIAKAKDVPLSEMLDAANKARAEVTL